MDVYKSDDEQVEIIKKWWEENGKSIVFGVVLGLGAIFGWRYWTAWNTEQAETASLLYQNLARELNRDRNSPEVSAISNKIINDYGSTAYAVFVKLVEAKLAADKQDYAGAESDLRWALENNSNDSLAALVRLRLAGVLMSVQRYDEALQTLAADPGEFSAAYDELRGDIHHARGEDDKARELYQAAVAAKTAANLDVTILQLKLDDLGRQ